MSSPIIPEAITQILLIIMIAVGCIVALMLIIAWLMDIVTSREEKRGRKS